MEKSTDTKHFINDNKPWFLGPCAENHQVLESILLDLLRDHIYWRRNFHPKDSPVLSTNDLYGKTQLDAVAKIKQELNSLCADLKLSIPLFSPRYLGHMASDVLLPGLLAQMITTLYNPNNVCDDVAPVTIQKEVEVGKQLAAMVGFDPKNSWGLLTSGGTVANYTALRNILAIRFYPFALIKGLLEFSKDCDLPLLRGKHLSQISSEDIFSLNFSDIISYKNNVFQQIQKKQGKNTLQECIAKVESLRFESLGLFDFISDYNLKPPVLFVPETAHYSWEKAMKLMGLGTSQLVSVEVNHQMRLDLDDLKNKVCASIDQNTPIIAVIGVLGTTEFGTIDPIHEIVKLQKHLTDQTYLPIHIDAAWGGYLCTVFKNEKKTWRSKNNINKNFSYFPSSHVYDAFTAISHVDSVTIDPHKLGYIPYPSGAYICRHIDILDFVSQTPPYVFDPEESLSSEEKLHNIGQYSLEGSKPGASAAAAYVTHKSLPLDMTGFGRLLSQTILSCEYFYDKVKALKNKLKDSVHISIPFEPDTNIACLCFNPLTNKSAKLANGFMRKIYETIQGDPIEPIQNKEFFISKTIIDPSRINSSQLQRIYSGLDLEFTEPNKNSLFVFRHTLMNPWLLTPIENNGDNYIDTYLSFLESVLITQLESYESHA